MDLAAQIASLVRAHLSEAHALLGQILARLDQVPAGQGPGANGIEAASVAAQVQVAGLSTKPGTVARRVRKHRQRLRQTNGAAEEAPAAAMSWPELRREFRVTATARDKTYSQIAAELELRRGSMLTWLSRDRPTPSAKTMGRFRQWIDEAPAAATDQAEPPPPFELSVEEQMAVRGYLSLGVDRNLRQQFGVARSVLEACADGQHMAPEVIARVRKALLGNGATAE